MLHITHEILSSVYDLLRLTPPFSRWKLPEADDIEFRATNCDDQALHWVAVDGDKEQHVIQVSPKHHHTLQAVLASMGHEMVHVHEYNIGFRRKTHHGWKFKILADQVCKHHGFDRGQF